MDQLLQAILGLIPVGVVVTLWLNRAARQRSRRELAIKLHEVFLNPEFYSQVRAPAFHISLKWKHLPDHVRGSYRTAVVSGWSLKPSVGQLSRYVSGYPSNESDAVYSHFQKPIAAPSLTEHQALTAFLRFWTRLNIYRKNHLIDRKLAKELFRDEFGYRAEFLKELANAVEASTTGSHIRPPRWIEDIRQLFNFFDCVDSTTPNNPVQTTAISSVPDR